MSGCGQSDTFFLEFLYEEPVRYLCEDPDSVAGLALGVFSGPVLQVLNDRKRIINYLVARPSFNVYDSADTAVIVFKCG